MTDRPTPPPQDPRAKRPTIANADVPSDTVGLPGVGEGASAAHFARDVPLGLQAGDDPAGEPTASSDQR